MRIIDVNDINNLLRDNAEEFIRSCECDYEARCRDIAEKIKEQSAVKPIILLSGPSGSGKTTTALKIEGYLDAMGVETHTVSMDNYFLPKDQIQIFDENNKIDYESPYRIDIKLMQEHMKLLADCRTVEMPAFDFPNQTRIKGRTLTRKKGELILFEGIHALNPEVTGSDDIANRIYVSVRTRLRLSDGELIHPEYIRLMRRMIRDRNFRNRCPEQTMDMFDSVQRGENLYIAPYKNRAEHHIDTFHEYEANVYRSLLEEDFAAMRESYDDYERFSPLERLIKELAPLDQSMLPKNCLCREFVGGSDYEY